MKKFLKADTRSSPGIVLLAAQEDKNKTSQPLRATFHWSPRSAVASASRCE
jgi:hypothetical protein